MTKMDPLQLPKVISVVTKMQTGKNEKGYSNQHNKLRYWNQLEMNKIKISHEKD